MTMTMIICEFRELQHMLINARVNLEYGIGLSKNQFLLTAKEEIDSIIRFVREVHIDEL